MKASAIASIHAVVSIIIALIFLNAGVKKFIPKAPRATDNAILLKAVTEDTYVSPASFQITMKAMKQSGFMYFIGVFQIAAAVLIVYPRTRLLGLLVLLPIVANIFLLHVFMDNRTHENIETGLLFGLTLLLTTFYYKKFSMLLTESNWFKS